MGSWYEQYDQILKEKPETSIPALWAEINKHLPQRRLYSEEAIEFLRIAPIVTGELIDFCLTSDMNRYDVLSVVDPRKCDLEGRERLKSLLSSENWGVHQIKQWWGAYVDLGLITGQEKWVEDRCNLSPNLVSVQWGQVGDHIFMAKIPNLKDEIYNNLLELALAKEDNSQARAEEFKSTLLITLYTHQKRLSVAQIKEILKETRDIGAVLVLTAALPWDDFVCGEIMRTLKQADNLSQGRGQGKNPEISKMTALFKMVIEKGTLTAQSEVFLIASRWPWLEIPDVEIMMTSKALTQEMRTSLLGHPNKEVRLVTIKAIGHQGNSPLDKPLGVSEPVSRPASEPVREARLKI